MSRARAVLRFLAPGATSITAAISRARAVFYFPAIGAVACSPAPPQQGTSPGVGFLFSMAEAQTSTPVPPSVSVTASTPVSPSVSVTASTPVSASPTSMPVSTSPTSMPVSPAPSPCQSDDDCRYDPTSARCGTDPRFNKQPPLVDQGLVCYCDAAAAACALLRVEPAPCEGETSCAVRLDPRPHPIRADAAHPYEKPRACIPPRASQPRITYRFTTCERTNICTMHTRECARP